ncbi:hypothetical protein [Streptomyces sp. NPDC000351]|uniref:hypothetical protein n=1 Tax=Streptomyces sp. NPDC000351 TaxID=3154250 RepID=UPI003326017B
MNAPNRPAPAVHRDLAWALKEQATRAGEGAPSVRGADWRTAVVTLVNLDGTVAADGIPAIRRLETYRNPAAGDLIVIQQASNGNWISPGRTAPTTDTQFTTFTPAVSGGGSATWATRTGWYTSHGGLITVCVHLVVNAAGSGEGLVAVDMPTLVYRGTRQVLAMHTESTGPNGSHIGDGQAVFFAGGSGPATDRLRTSSNDALNRDANLTGSDLLAGGTITIQGSYRAA